ncbi:MAG: glycoside hydrolase family 16 protein, partial [Chitinophagaceae bacterium]
MYAKYLNKITLLLKKGGSLLLLTFALAGCEKKAEQSLPNRKWELTWSDEFNTNSGSLPDASKWVFDIGAGGWGNSEFQYYTNRPSNVSTDGNGNLVITARRENFAGAGFTSARIKTKAKFEQAYGRFEARIKTPVGPGIWPAFWMLGADIDTNPWPFCGEIDIMEKRGQEPNIIHGSVHGPGY